MPKSRTRKKKTSSTYVAPTAMAATRKKRSRRWVGPAVLSLLLLGVVWLVVAYMTGGTAPVQDKLGDWNVIVGFAFIAGGFALATQWR